MVSIAVTDGVAAITDAVLTVSVDVLVNFVLAVGVAVDSTLYEQYNAELIVNRLHRHL